MPVIISGGQEADTISKHVFGLSFTVMDLNGLKVVEASVEQEFPDMPTPRYLHQSVKIGTDLFVFGGKNSPSDINALNSVFKLRIHELVSKEPHKAAKDINWKECAPMKSARCLFASTVIDEKFVYVYGGISGSSNKRPTLSETAFERYDVVANLWTDLVVENAPRLSAFGWTRGDDEHEMFILGGSDGGNLQSSLWSFDLKKLRATNLNIEYESATGLNKMAAIKDPKTGAYKIHSFGGSQSNGASYWVNLNQEKQEWKVNESSYLSLVGSSLENNLLFNQSI